MWRAISSASAFASFASHFDDIVCYRLCMYAVNFSVDFISSFGGVAGFGWIWSFIFITRAALFGSTRFEYTRACLENSRI